MLDCSTKSVDNVGDYSVLLFLSHFLSYLLFQQAGNTETYNNKQCLAGSSDNFLLQQIAFNCSYMMFKILVC
jgi:hypothetical protein